MALFGLFKKKSASSSDLGSSKIPLMDDLPPISSPSSIPESNTSGPDKLFPDTQSPDDMPMPPPLVDHGNSVKDIPSIPNSPPPIWTDDEPPVVEQTQQEIQPLVEENPEIPVAEDPLTPPPIEEVPEMQPEPEQIIDSPVDDLPSFEEPSSGQSGVIEDPKEFLQSKGMSLENLFVEKEHYTKMLSLLEETMQSEREFAKEDKRYTKLAQKQAKLLQKASSGFLKINKNLVSIEEKLGRV